MMHRTKEGGGADKNLKTGGLGEWARTLHILDPNN